MCAFINHIWVILQDFHYLHCISSLRTTLIISVSFDSYVKVCSFEDCLWTTIILKCLQTPLFLMRKSTRVYKVYD